MKVRKRNIILISTLLGFLLFPSITQNDYLQEVSTTVLSSENVESITLYSTESDVLRIFGKPEKIHKTKNPISSYYKYAGLEIGINNQQVFRYIITDNYTTQHGIKVGDSKEHVIDIYGNNYYKKTESGSFIMGYIDYENNIILEIALNKDCVIGMLIKKSSSN
ncbi:hypothetical protein [Piscibacillus salipiscarius]|uniref:DUF4367 domain-containing protein n=1 Tax=Piscibacillus salipiscarius TaxID=299480 RepID=A0ABW5Q8N1_9BACI